MRTSYGEVPPRVEYALTPHGRKLKPVLEAMCGWGQEHIRLRGPEAPALQYVNADGTPVYVWPDPAAA